MQGLMFVLFVLLAGGIAYAAHLEAKKRLAALRDFAGARQLRFYPDKDRDFGRHFPGFHFLHQGSNRYARYRMEGEVGGKRLMLAEYHYQVTRQRGKSSHTQHYWFTLVMLRPSFRLNDLEVRREGFFDKIKGAFGWDDIDFASAEFSRQFHVRAPDRNWAFAVIQPETMDMLMRSPNDLAFYMAQGWLLICVRQRLDLTRLDRMIARGCELLDGIPDFCREPL